MKRWLGASGVLCAEAITAEEFRVVEADGRAAEATRGERLLLGRLSVVRDAIRAQRAAWGNGTASEFSPASGLFRARAIVAAPMVREKGSAGIALAFHSDARLTFSEAQADEFAAFATLAGSLVQNAKLLSWIEQSKKQWVQDFDAITDLIAVHDSRNSLLRLNRGLANFFGKSPAELVGAPMSSLNGLGARCEGGECPFCAADGGSDGGCLLIAQGRSYLISTSHVPENGQERGRTIHVLKDMTGQREAERRYRELFESIQEGLFSSDLEGRILEVNQAFVEMFGLRRRSELRGRPVECLIPAMRRSTLTAAIESTRMGQQIWNLELPLRRSDGSTRQYSVNLSPMRDEEGNVRGIVGSVADVTEASVLRAKLMQAGKMAAVGQLVAGVAHEVNNPLAAIFGFSKLLLENPAIPKSAQEELELIHLEAQRMKSIVENLLQFARPIPVQSETVDVGNVARQALQLRDHDFKTHGVDVVLRLDENLPSVAGDAQQLLQVFLNILNNAFDAVRETERRGRMEIEASHKDSSVEIVFRDNGPGIADTDSVFDPFYSTKEAGKGTGLGLSICYGIVQAHGGEIFCENNGSGIGCAFHVHLPAAKALGNLEASRVRPSHVVTEART
ncbi:MAG: PAS domain S-box protein [Candidatus Acidiferrales bacterium]